MNSSAPRVLLSRRVFFFVWPPPLSPELERREQSRHFRPRFRPHGHEYALDCAYKGPISLEDGMIVNISDIKPILNSAVSGLDGRFLDADVEWFRTNRPTAENITDFLWQTLPHSTGDGTLHRLRLFESRRVVVEKTATSMKTSRSYEFAAAHRLFAPTLSEGENWNRFDKCSNPAGHGHNFGLEVAVEGQPDAETGFIILPKVLDAIVDQEVFTRFDHKHLNLDCPEFDAIIPTSENLAKVIFQLLEIRLKSEGFKLSKIGLHETQKNYFEVEAGDTL